MNKSQELTWSDGYYRWIKKEECFKKKRKEKEESGGEGDVETLAGFAWLG